MKAGYFTLTTFAVATLVLVLLTEPALAQENATEQLEQVNWFGIIEALIRFVANILETAAEIMRKGVENLNEGYNSTQS